MAIATTRTSKWLYSTANLPTTGAWTFCAFARINTDHNAFAQLLGAYGTSPAYKYWVMQVDSTGLTINVDIGGIDTSMGPTVSLNEWFFVALRKTGSAGGHGIVIELDTGTLTKNESDTTTTVDAFTQFTVGNYDSDTGNGIDASFAGIKLWDASLTDAELRVEARCLWPARTANLNRWSSGMQSTISDAVKDLSGNGRDWSQYGSPTVDSYSPPVKLGNPIIPVLSAAGVNSITATTAVPKVTLTY